MAIQLCPVDTANVHPRNILGSSSSFDRERLSPFGSLSSRCWEPVSLLHVRKQVSLSSAQVGRFNGVPRLLWSTSPSAPGRPSLVANPARKGTLSSIARTPPAVASRRYARTGGQRLVEAGRSVLFAPAYRLVQDLLAAKRDLALPRQLRKLDSYDFLLLDDLGYLPQGAEESEVFFTLIAERYERRSLGITSNLVFSQWEHIFANPMATVAAIDRVVHHSVILEFDVPSYRTGVAQQRGQEREVNRQE